MAKLTGFRHDVRSHAMNILAMSGPVKGSNPTRSDPESGEIMQYFTFRRGQAIWGNLPEPTSRYAKKETPGKPRVSYSQAKEPAYSNRAFTLVRL